MWIFEFEFDFDFEFEFAPNKNHTVTTEAVERYGVSCDRQLAAIDPSVFEASVINRSVSEGEKASDWLMYVNKR